MPLHKHLTSRILITKGYQDNTIKGLLDERIYTISWLSSAAEINTKRAYKDNKIKGLLDQRIYTIA